MLASRRGRGLFYLYMFEQKVIRFYKHVLIVCDLIFYYYYGYKFRYMKQSLLTFYKNNKHLIFIVALVWIVGLLAIDIVALTRNEQQKSKEIPRGFIPPIDPKKKELIMTQEDTKAKPLVVTPEKKAEIINREDPKAKVLPEVSDEEKLRIMMGN